MQGYYLARMREHNTMFWDQTDGDVRRTIGEDLDAILS